MPELAGIGEVPACLAKHASLRNRRAPAGPADDHRGGDSADAALLEQVWGVRLDQVGELGEQLLLFLGDLVDPPQLGFGDSQLRTGRQLAELASEPSSDPWAFERFWPELRLAMRRDPDEMPSQPVDQPDSLVHQLITVITQDPDLMGLLVQERDRQALNPLTDRGQRDRRGIDRIRLPRVLVAFRDWPVSDGGTRITRSPAPSSARSSRLVTCRQSSTAHTRSQSRPTANRNAFRTPSSLA